jgi:hypothetical protein
MGCFLLVELEIGLLKEKGIDESEICSHARSAITPLMKNKDFIVHIL